MVRKKLLLGAAGKGLGERLLLCLSLDGWRERDCSVFGFDLATSRFMALFQFFGLSVEACQGKTCRNKVFHVLLTVVL